MHSTSAVQKKATDNMDSTRKLRWKWILEEKPTIEEVLLKFPYMSFETTVSSEYI